MELSMIFIATLLFITALSSSLRTQQAPEEKDSKKSLHDFYVILERIWLELRELNEQRRQANTPDPRIQLDRVSSMDGYQFEAFMAGTFQRLGYEVSPMGSSGDQGVDLLFRANGELIAVQCKNYGRPVGNTPVQEVFAGAKYHNADRTMVVAPAGFTPGAIELAERTDTQLIDLDGIERLLQQSSSRQETHGDTKPGYGKYFWWLVAIFFLFPLIISVILILIPPLGLYLMWKHTEWDNKIKWIITAITVAAVIVILIWAAITGQQPPTNQPS